MADSMSCVVLHGIRDVRIEQRPIPEPGPGEVLVRVKRVGICGSDVHYLAHGRIGNAVVREPMVLGHESSGVVEEIGSTATALNVGDRVAIEPGRTCGSCFYCKTGRYNLCPNVRFMASPPVDGSLCEYVAWPADLLFPLPDSLTFEEGAMMEPLAVGLWAAERGEVRPGDSVAVFGCGPIGLVTLQAARVAGASTVIGVDIQDYRLEHARRMGATHVLNDTDGTALEQLRSITSGLRGVGAAHAGVDVSYETAGTLPTVRNALGAVRRGGIAVLVGSPPTREVEIDLVATTRGEIDIRGQFRYANCYPRAIALVSSGQVDVASLVTHHFPLSRAYEALEFAETHKSESLKVVVDIDG